MLTGNNAALFVCARALTHEHVSSAEAAEAFMTQK